MQLSGLNKCISCARITVKNEGLSSLYRSLPITLCMNAPYHISTVIINENMKKIVKPNERKYKFLAYFYCAALAGGISSFLTCPMDNIKTRLQTQGTVSSCVLENNINKLNKSEQSENKNKVSGSNKIELNTNNNENSQKIKYKNIKDTFLTIVKEEGVGKKGLFRGAIPRMLFNAPSCAISWGSYEIMKHVLTDKI
jgi:solute carrier family 25 iron transporter 28/37